MSSQGWRLGRRLTRRSRRDSTRASALARDVSCRERKGANSQIITSYLILSYLADKIQITNKVSLITPTHRGALRGVLLIASRSSVSNRGLVVGPRDTAVSQRKGDNGFSAAPPRERGFGTARHERHPPSAGAHAMAAGASFSATATWQSAWWLAWLATLRRFASERPRACFLCAGGGRTKLLNVLHLPVGDANLLDRVPVRILHEHVRWRTLRVRHLHVRIVLQLALRKLLDGRVLRDASAAHVEHGARVHDARVVRLFLAAARALAHQRVALPHKFTQLVTRCAE